MNYLSYFNNHTKVACWVNFQYQIKRNKKNLYKSLNALSLRLPIQNSKKYEYKT